MPFDPAVLTDDDGRVYLYYGFAPAQEKEMQVPEFDVEEISKMPEYNREMMKILSNVHFGEKQYGSRTGTGYGNNERDTADLYPRRTSHDGNRI